MTETEQQEIQKLIETGKPDEIGVVIVKIQKYSERLQYWDIYKPITILNGKLDDYNNKKLSGEFITGLFEDILSKLINIFREFIRIYNASSNSKVPPVYILTATAGTISETLSKEIYCLLKPPLQYKNDYQEWLPFSESKESIGDIILELKNKGFEFDQKYIPHTPGNDDKLKIMIEINNNLNDAIAIVDLLAIHEGNEDIAKKFSDLRIKQVITPVDTNLDTEVRNYMIKIGAKIFAILEYDVFASKPDMYEPRLPAKFNVIKALSRVLHPKNVVNKISGIDQNYKFKGLGSGFQ